MGRRPVSAAVAGGMNGAGFTGIERLPSRLGPGPPRPPRGILLIPGTHSFRGHNT